MGTNMTRQENSAHLLGLIDQFLADQDTSTDAVDDMIATLLRSFIGTEIEEELWAPLALFQPGQGEDSRNLYSVDQLRPLLEWARSWLRDTTKL